MKRGKVGISEVRQWVNENSGTTLVCGYCSSMNYCSGSLAMYGDLPTDATCFRVKDMLEVLDVEAIRRDLKAGVIY